MYCINPESDEPIFLLDEPIGRDEDRPELPYIDGNMFARELLQMDGAGKKRIQIWINSEGGSVKDGMSIISAILKTQTIIDTLVTGIAYSISGVISLMGRNREAMDFSSLMFHNPYNVDGSKDDGLEVIRKSLVTAVASRTGKTDEEVETIFNATTFYTAEEADLQGLVKSLPSTYLNKPRLTTQKDIYEFGKKVYNKLIINNKGNMKTVAKALGLNSEANEEVILSAVTKIKNEADEVDKLRNELKTATENCESLKNKLAKMEDDKIKAEADAKAKAEEDVAVKAKAEFDEDAKNKIETACKARNISDVKTIANYKKLATNVESLTSVIETIESIQLIKPAVSILNAQPVDVKDSAFPIIPISGTDKNGHPIIGDTSAFVNAMNRYNKNVKA